MKPARSIAQFAFVLASLSGVTSAWPSWLPELDSLVARQDDNGSSSSSNKPQQTPSPSASQSGSKDAKTTGKDADNTHNLNTGAVKTGDKTPNQTGNSTDSHKPDRTMFNPGDPAGAVVMVTPSLAQGMQLYKIDDKVTFGWNYTNLLGTPTAIDVLASCSTASRTYTLTQNMTFATPATFTWDTKDTQDLLTAEYTLIIYDAEAGPSATAEPGYLSTFNSLVFGLYNKRPYTSIADGWQCAICSAAAPSVDSRAVGFAMTMSVLTVLSFTWFVAGVGAGL